MSDSSVDSQGSNSFAFNRLSLLLIFVLPFLSGAAALSHELLWTRRLVDLLGATDWVIGRVLGLFFFGLSLGGYFATFLSRRKSSAVSQLGAAEFAIAILALPAAFLPLWSDGIWVMLGTEALVGWPGGIIKLLLSALVVLPPAIAMGFTMPLFIRAASELGSNVASVESGAIRSTLLVACSDCGSRRRT